MNNHPLTTRSRNIAAVLAVASLAIVAPAKAETIFEYLRSYYTIDAHLPQNVDVQEETTTEFARRIEFTYSTFDNQLVPARLEIPKGTQMPPVIILLHGLTQSREQWWRTDDGPYSFPSHHRDALVQAGFAVLAIDARSHGERKSDTDFDDLLVYLSNGYVDAVRKLIAETAIDVRGAIDALNQVGGVNVDQVGLVGYSFGAFAGYLASAVDPRIDASLLMAMPILPVTEGQGASFTSPLAYAPGFEGKTLGFIAATEDTIYTRESFDALVAELPAEPQVNWIEGGHDLPEDTAAISVAFFQKAF